MHELDVYCTVDKASGLLTGAFCAASNKEFEAWYLHESMDKTVDIKRMNSVSFLNDLDEQDIYMNELEQLFFGGLND